MTRPKIEIRDFSLEDIIAQDAYMTQASDEYLYNLGVDPSIIRNGRLVPERVASLLAIPVKDRLVHTYAVDLNQELVGVAVLKKIKFGESADLHAHIFKISDRHKGIATEAFKEILKKAFETYELKILICEPTSTNAPPNQFLQKMGLKVVNTFEQKAEGILRDRISNRYEIKKEFYLANFDIF